VEKIIKQIQFRKHNFPQKAGQLRFVDV